MKWIKPIQAYGLRCLSLRSLSLSIIDHFLIKSSYYDRQLDLGRWLTPKFTLLDRSEKYLVEADASSWLEWAGKSGHIHPAITAYITDHPKDLFGAVDPEDRYADPSPRGWSRASEILYKGEERGWNTTVLNKKVCGCVG